MKGKVEFTAEIFKEGEVYVSLCPELNVSSFGDSVDEAKESLAEAVTAFLEECKTMGTFEEVQVFFERRVAGCRAKPWLKAS